ncbi:MAG: RidA family protein [Rhodobacteraceae bacterium]|nr:RidA family protein [Paracoccaceae bacterium]
MSRIEDRLAQRGLHVPSAPPPAANYIPYRTAGSIVYVSGQLSDGALGHITGTLGIDLDIEQGQRASRQCALNLLGQVRTACDGDLDRLQNILKLTGFVNSAPDFIHHPQVINGASDFLVDIMGDRGHHARSAVGVASLPFGFAVEIEGIFEIAT